MNRIERWISDVLKEAGSDTVCIARVMAIITFVSFLGYAGYGLYKDHFELSNFANRIMQVLLGCGAVIGIKNATSK
jgi:hypothetical protein